jgi:predicted dehydrogenase
MSITPRHTRRAFLQTSLLGGAGILLLPNSRLAFATEANSKLNVAGIGVGGQGHGDLENIAGAGASIVALCDVDEARAGDTFKKFPQASRYQDFRRMFDQINKQIDAVLVATPDHTHAVAAVAAMKHGKHVYCEKPLTRTVYEARVMRQVAAKSRVVTQMGNQGSASNGLRRAVELVWQGTIGDVREAHIWFDGGNGPKQRPADHPPVPTTLDWDLWLGPAPERPYHPCYVPARWRDWRAFGSGIVGDFGCHTANLMFRALKLNELWDASKKAAGTLRVEARPSERDDEGYPASMIATVQVPARGSLPPVKLTFYAKDKPAEELLLDHPRGPWGDLLIGSKGCIYSDCPWNTRYALFPRASFPNHKSVPPQTLPVSAGHHREWVEACKGNGKTFSGFEMGGPLTELMQLVNVASLVDGPFDYDPISGRVKNSARASDLLQRKYRKGWKL